MDQNTIEKGKSLALVAYLTLIGTLIAFFFNQEKRNPFIAFHVRQALGLGFLYVIMGYFIGYFNSWMITYAFWIFFAALFFYGLLGAATGKLNKIPFLGDFFQNVFKSMGQ